MAIETFTIEDFRGVVYDLPHYFTETTDGNEVVFDTRMDEGTFLRVYTSIDADSGEVRPDSWDAIRVHFRGATRMPGKEYEVLALSDGRYKHIKRTDGWDGRVADRIDSYTTLYPSILRECPNCGDFLAIRSGDDGAFAGCTGYHPDADDACSYTEDL